MKKKIFSIKYDNIIIKYYINRSYNVIYSNIYYKYVKFCLIKQSGLTSSNKNVIRQ